MNARKLLSILLALLLALAILPAGAAGDPFCMVGATAYDDLAAAAQAASSSGEPILITKDFDCAGQLELDGLVVTVELQGFTLNVTQASGTHRWTMWCDALPVTCVSIPMRGIPWTASRSGG